MKKLEATEKDKRYLIAVSGGPDSMALLDMAKRSGLYIEAAHINYHKRATAKRDEKIVRDYCRQNGIVFHKRDFDPDTCKGNFQAAARDFRYDQFLKICRKNRLEAVLVAHQLDDLVETYIMQKEKKLGVACYGLAQTNMINGVKVIRPLLKYSKDELEGYCQKRGIEYGIDESNLTDDYTRNRIRHERVSKLSADEKKKIYRETVKLNKENERRFTRAYKKLYGKRMKASAFFKVKYLDYFLRHYFRSRSEANIAEMIRQLKEADHVVLRADEITIVKEYGMIEVFRNEDDYLYTFRDLKALRSRTYPHFRISRKGKGTDAVTFRKDDFPVVIRNAKKGDEIVLRFGTKKLNRFFIDRKIPYADRLIYPVLVNRKGQIILVPELGCDLMHYSQKPDIFVIKL